MGTWGVGPFENDQALEFLKAMTKKKFDIVESIKRFTSLNCDEDPSGLEEFIVAAEYCAYLWGHSAEEPLPEEFYQAKSKPKIAHL